MQAEAGFKVKQLLMVISAILIAVPCVNASTIIFTDLGEKVSLTLDGMLVTGNGGRITNFTLNGESISFDLSTNGINFISKSAFTSLLDPVGSDDPLNTVSDIFMFATTLGAQTYHVVFGSDPNLPTIPGGATDLTTVLQQGLPANPYYEDGTVQKVATAFSAPFVALDTFFIQSDVGIVPEPSTFPLIGAVLVLSGISVRFFSRPRMR